MERPKSYETNAERVPTETIGQTFPRPGQPGYQFPHCPGCGSYALYRKNGLGSYECQTCGCREITEELARRVQ